MNEQNTYWMGTVCFEITIVEPHGNQTPIHYHAFRPGRSKPASHKVNGAYSELNLNLPRFFSELRISFKN